MWKSGKKQKPEKDTCVICGKETEYTKDTPIQNRIGYVEGAGQLCRDCHMELYLKGQGCHG